MSSPVTLADFKQYLNLTSNSGPGGDTELQAFLDSATDLLAQHVGTIVQAQVVESVHGGAPVIVTGSNIVSVTSVVEWVGTTSYTLTEQDYATAGPFGSYGYSVVGPRTLQRMVTGYGGRFAAGRYNIVVTYQAGWATVPNVILMGIRELAKHMFKTQSGSRSGQAAIPNAGSTLPDRVLELIAPYDDAGMFA